MTAPSYDFILKKAIDLSAQSLAKGHFPAGAALANVTGFDAVIIGTGISGSKSDYRHAEVNAIESGLREKRSFDEATILYSSMEPCLMCLSTAYWAGIRKVIYAVGRSELPDDYYESDLSLDKFNELLHEHIELKHLPDPTGRAMEIIQQFKIR
jgi:tRNA(Arg) A34 adenosine deaminase TadA